MNGAHVPASFKGSAIAEPPSARAITGSDGALIAVNLPLIGVRGPELGPEKVSVLDLVGQLTMVPVVRNGFRFQ